MLISPMSYRMSANKLSMNILQTNTSPAASAAQATKRTAVNKEITGLNEAAQRLQSAVDAFDPAGMLAGLFVSSPSGTVYTSTMTEAATELIDAYNQANDSLKNSKYVTGEGAKLLQQVGELLQGPDAAKFKEIGFEFDAVTGKISFDERKFKSALYEDAENVMNLFMDDDYLAPMLNNVVNKMLGKSAGYYFNTNFSVNA